MRPQSAEAFRLAHAEGQVVIEFGRVDEVRGLKTLQISDRVSLAPETAARLLQGLREALAQRASLAEDDSAGDSLAGPQGAGATPLNLPPDPAGEQAARLLALVAGLGVPYQYERSFRLAPGSLQANRFLTTMDRADLGPDALERVLAVARAMGLPAVARDAVAARFDGARCIHFGFEAGGGSPVMRAKLYLERRVPAEESAAAAAAGQAVALHHAWKWDVASGEAVQTVYDWHPGLDAAAIATRLRALYGGDPANAESLAIALDLLALAAARTAADGLQYLEVTEPDSRRRSFDLNVYDAGLAVRDALPLLLRMRERQGVRPGQFQALVDQVKALQLGHLAGGVHRDGQDFFNVYYGVAGFPRFASARA